jgi:hypothetical protein
MIFSRKGPAQKVASTNIVNQLEPQLQRNLSAYRNGPRTRANQSAALANFDAAWAYLASSQACGSPDLGNPGKACISDRARGGKWDWFRMYRDPIANDESVSDSAVGIALTELAPNASAGLVAAVEQWAPVGILAALVAALVWL